MRVVHAVWIDSCAEIGWETHDGDPDPTATHTVGFLINEGEYYTVIANSYDPGTNEWNGKMAIPNVSLLEPLRTICQIKTT